MQTIAQNSGSSAMAGLSMAELTRLKCHIRRLAPGGLLARHPCLVEAAVCGHLFRLGCEDERLVREVSGKSVARMVVRICKLLDDSDASIWYFRTLDEIAWLGDHSSHEARETDDATCGRGDYFNQSKQAMEMMNDRMKMSGTYVLLIMASGVLAAAILALSWLPESRLGDQWPMPWQLAQWLDAEDNSNRRTAFPFIALGLLLGALRIRRISGFPGWAGAMVLMTTLAVIAEAGQLLLPERTTDPRDIGLAALGGLTGIVTAWSCGRITRIIKCGGEDPEIPAPQTDRLGTNPVELCGKSCSRDIPGKSRANPGQIPGKKPPAPQSISDYESLRSTKPIRRIQTTHEVPRTA